jgi:ABC-type lipopolysaccharide export system ATPase subunit
MRLDEKTVERVIEHLDGLVWDKSVKVIAASIVLDGGERLHYTIERAKRWDEALVLLDEKRVVVDVYPLAFLSAGEIFDALIREVEETYKREVIDVNFESN